MNKHEIFVTGKYSNELTLLTVNRDLSTMDEQEFVSFMRDAVNAAQHEYDEIMNVYNERYIEECKKRHRDGLYRQYSTKLNSYKRESSRARLIAQIERECASYEPTPRSSDIFFDTMPMCHDNGINTLEILSTASEDRAFRYVFERYQDMLKNADGVVFKYEITGENEFKPYSFRPWMEFIIPEDEMNELKEENRRTHERIQRFYDSLKYKGD